jgi:hypothetical protein
LKRLLIVTLLAATLLRADSKDEVALRAQLAQTQAALAAASKDRIAMQVELTAAVAKLGAANKVQAAADTQQRANVSNKAEASAVRADANAAQAQQTADSARVTAEAANTQAVISAVAAKVQADALIRVSDQSHTAALATLITSCFGFLTLIAGFAWKAFTDARDHRWVVAAAVDAARDSASHRAVELVKLDTVASTAQAAYKEANDVNRKIETIGLRVADNLPLKPV